MVTRLSGGLTPADGADPRTFPAIWNATATDIETAESEIDSLQLSVNANGTAITALQGSAVALGSAIDVIEAWDLDDLNDVTVTSPTDAQVLAYSTATSGWVNADAATGGGGLTHISTQTFTGVSSVSLNSVFTSDFANYKVVCSRFSSTSAGITALQWRLRQSGTDNTAANYNWQYWRLYGTGTAANGGNIAQTSGIISYFSTGAEHGFSFDILNPQIGQTTQLFGSGYFYQSDIASTIAVNFAGYEGTANTYDGFTLFPAGGNFSGTIRVYGYQNS